VADIEVAIVGAGAIGLACAARLARSGRSVIVLERNLHEGEESSTRNSGVIHAGLYNAPGSLKATTCVEGRARLYARCERENLPHMRCGKLVVATDAAERADRGFKGANCHPHQPSARRVYPPAVLP
jgi:L-2-hydroxyglutarate oxidase LhgO